MATTYTLIASSTVGVGGTTAIDFTSIPGTYTDLKLVYSVRDDRATVIPNNIQVTFNGSATGYSERVAYGNGSTTASTSRTGTYFNFVYVNAAGSTASTFSNSELYIPNYAGSINKSMSGDFGIENNGTGSINAMDAYLWSNTAAITRVTLTVDGAYTFQQYSTAYLYGITKA